MRFSMLMRLLFSNFFSINISEYVFEALNMKVLLPKLFLNNSLVQIIETFLKIQNFRIQY